MEAAQEGWRGQACSQEVSRRTGVGLKEEKGKAGGTGRETFRGRVGKARVTFHHVSPGIRGGLLI